MIGLDTNVIARLFVDDNAAQVKAARRFVAERCKPNAPGFIDRVALCETVWVLTSVHGYERQSIADVIQELLASRDIVLEDHGAVREALRIFRTHNIDFADALMAVINRARGCEATATFDRKAARLELFQRVG